LIFHHPHAGVPVFSAGGAHLSTYGVTAKCCGKHHPTGTWRRCATGCNETPTLKLVSFGVGSLWHTSVREGLLRCFGRHNTGTESAVPRWKDDRWQPPKSGGDSGHTYYLSCTIITDGWTPVFFLAGSFVQPQRHRVTVALCCRTFSMRHPSPWALQMRLQRPFLNALEQSERGNAEGDSGFACWQWVASGENNAKRRPVMRRGRTWPATTDALGLADCSCGSARLFGIDGGFATSIGAVIEPWSTVYDSKAMPSQALLILSLMLPSSLVLCGAG